ncbi:MAG: thiamine-phosphate kinase [Nocardia sp.]|nr:thiamine-phosphate kinase [Nocardia sp.]
MDVWGPTDSAKETAISDSTPRTVGELGEFGLIARMNAGRRFDGGVLLGPGDDAAVIAAPAQRYVVSTDMLVEDRHFRLDWSTPRQIGAKAIAQNAADVVAMGAAPSGFVIGLGCPADTPVARIDELVEGMWTEAGRAGAPIAGGDVVRAPQLVISVTAFGDPPERPVLRSGARAGDTVSVAGRLGWSAAGLAVLTSGLESDLFADVLAAHRVPQPPYAAVLDLPADMAPVALTDISDGLLADITHIAESSGVAVDIESAALADPALDAVAAELGADASDWVLTGGEDHAFLAVFAAGTLVPPGWRAIGLVREGAGVLVDGAPRPGSPGWESFGGHS